MSLAEEYRRHFYFRPTDRKGLAAPLVLSARVREHAGERHSPEWQACLDLACVALAFMPALSVLALLACDRQRKRQHSVRIASCAKEVRSNLHKTTAPIEFDRMMIRFAENRRAFLLRKRPVR